MDIDNIYCYFKLLQQYKKTYRERGAWKRWNNAPDSKLVDYYKRFGEPHFKSELKDMYEKNINLNSPHSGTN